VPFFGQALPCPTQLGRYYLFMYRLLACGKWQEHPRNFTVHSSIANMHACCLFCSLLMMWAIQANHTTIFVSVYVSVFGC